MHLCFRTLTAAASVVAIVGTVVGCPDPEATFEDFGERYEEADPSTNSVTVGPVGDCTVPEAGGEADGDYVFALSAQLGPTKPILFDSDLAVQDDGAGNKTFTLSLIPLRTPYRTAADNENVPPMSPVGPPIELGPFPLAIDGTFTADFPPLQVTGQANPFSSNDLAAEVSIEGQICTEADRPGVRLGFICGRLEGQVTEPLSLALTPDKNNFTITKYEGTPPETYAVDCAETAADPFP